MPARQLFRSAGWKRDEVVLANKLWWEFWPQESAAAELDGSLRRMGMDYMDLAYAERPPEGLTVEQVADLDLAYAPPFSPVWDPVAIAAREAAKLV